MIRVIEQTTAERNQEIRELFEEMKPLILDEGLSYNMAYKLVKGLSYDVSVNSCALLRDVIVYGESQGGKNVLTYRKGREKGSINLVNRRRILW